MVALVKKGNFFQQYNLGQLEGEKGQIKREDVLQHCDS